MKVTQSCLTLCNTTDYTVHEFFRPEYWSGQSFPSPGELPNPGIKPRSPIIGGFFTSLATREAPFPPYYLPFLDCLLSYCTPLEYSMSLMNGLNKKFQWYINRDIISLVDTNPHCISLLKKNATGHLFATNYSFATNFSFVFSY